MSRFNFSFIPGSGLILERGHLRIALSFSSILMNMLLIMGATLLAVWRPAREGSRVQPVLAMRGGA
jgi:ABC-type lipoprotein release transport system permease subunit